MAKISDPIEPRECSVCEKSFTPARRDKKVCSPECHNRNRKARGRKPNEKSKAATARRGERRTLEGIRDKVYIAFDGEGLTLRDWDEDAARVTDENHVYQYMAAADTNGNVGELFPREGDHRLRTEDMLWWMWKLGKGKSCWFFSGKYDWTHIFRDLAINVDTRSLLHQIHHADRNPDGSMRDPFTAVRWGDWGVTYLQGSVKITRYFRKDDGEEFGVEAFFQDAFKCFGGGSFVSMLTAWDVGTPEQRDEIARMKEQRSQFTWMTPEVRGYCIQEVQLLAVACQKILTIFATMGIRPKGGRCYSAGSFAKALLRVHKIPAEFDQDGNQVWDGYRGADRYAGADDEIRDILLRTYFGGRFENAETGIFDELHSEDFKSAYPAVIRDLPCLAHGEWTRGYVKGAVTFGHVAWSSNDPEHARWGPFPWRWPDGRIYYPASGQGWYCEAEIRSAQKLQGTDIQELEWISYVPTCEHMPFSWVQEVYDLRVQLGNDGRGLALKVTLNSIYGTFADTISLDSVYASIIWASMITGGCRAKILDELAWRGDKIVSIATDGIMSTEKSPAARRTNVLGELNYEGAIKDVFLMQPGLYLAAEGADPKKMARSRGHGIRDLKAMESELRAAWLRDGWNAQVQYQRERFIPAKLALARREPLEVYGQWITDPVTIKMKPSSRVPCSDDGPRKRSFPSSRHLFAVPMLDEDSAPYSKFVSMVRNQALIDAKELEDAQP